MPTIEDGMEVDKKPVVHFFDSEKITERTLSGAGTKVVKRTRQNIEELLNLYDEKTEEITNPRARKMRRTTDTKGFMKNVGKVVPCITSTRSPQGLSIVKAKLKNYSTSDDPQAKWIVPPHSLVFARRTQGVDGIEAFSDVQNFQNDMATTSIYTLLGASLEDGLDAEKFHEQHEARRYFSVAVQGVVSLHCDAEICKNWTFGDPVFITTRPFRGSTGLSTDVDVFRLQPYDTTHFQFTNWGNYRVGFFVEQIDKTLGGIRVKLDISNQIDYSQRGTATNNNFTKRFENAAKKYESLRAQISSEYAMAKEKSIENALTGGSSGFITYGGYQFEVEDSLGQLYEVIRDVINDEYRDFLKKVNVAAANLNLKVPLDIAERVIIYKQSLEYFSLDKLFKTQKLVIDKITAASASALDATITPEKIQKKKDSVGDGAYNNTLLMFEQIHNLIDSIDESREDFAKIKKEFSLTLEETKSYHSKKYNHYLEDRQKNYDEYISDFAAVRELGNQLYNTVQEFIATSNEIEEEISSEASSVAEGQGTNDTSPPSPQAARKLDELLAAVDDAIAGAKETLTDVSTPSPTNTGESEASFVEPAIVRPKHLRVTDELKAEQQKVYDAAVIFLPAAGRGRRETKPPQSFIRTIVNRVSPKRFGGKGATDEQNEEPTYQAVMDFVENVKKRHENQMNAEERRSFSKFIEDEFAGVAEMIAEIQTDENVDEESKEKYKIFFKAVQSYVQYVNSL